MSLRGFVGYRGNVRMIRADNGSNVVGVYLNHAFQEMDHIKMEKKLTTTCNTGGVWEHQIWSARATLNSSLKT